MKVKKTRTKSKGIKIILEKEGQTVARAFLYVLYNDLHQEPFGFMEDVWVEEEMRSQGLGTKIVKEIIKEARGRKCYKLITTSRYSMPRVHKLYQRLGFKDYGKEFRMDLK